MVPLYSRLPWRIRANSNEVDTVDEQGARNGPTSLGDEQPGCAGVGLYDDGAQGQGLLFDGCIESPLSFQRVNQGSSIGGWNLRQVVLRFEGQFLLLVLIVVKEVRLVELSRPSSRPSPTATDAPRVNSGMTRGRRTDPIWGLT